MTAPRPVLNRALAAVAAAAAACAVITADLATRAHTHSRARDRATATARGTVVQDGIGDNDDIRVRWRDAAARTHTQRFEIYATDRYTTGRSFLVAYDPAAADPRGFPADPQETAAEDDLTVPLALTAAGTGALLLTWTLRGLLHRRTARRPGPTLPARVDIGTPLRPAPFRSGDTVWIALPGAGAPHAETRWQRVMWHPALDELPDAFDVVVHGDPAARRRVVPHLPDGTLLVPVGRLRRRPPERFLLQERSAVRASLRDSFTAPAGAPPPQPASWLRRAAAPALAGTALGTAIGLLTTGPGPSVPLFALAGAALLVNTRALSGTED
ncbi:hypothetical protein [Streptomyces sp. NPDC001380]|uniref:hypothetical protein n=1 Tax=Streptomyces sp. NPDC001380 TaxID=3364566 RepID=UPI0036962D29